MTSKIIFAAGLGSTGSSALVDLLKEVQGFYAPDDEFRLFVDPKGLINLGDALTDNWSLFQGDTALRDFSKLTKDLNRDYLGNYFTLNHKKYFDNYLLNRSKQLVEDLTEVNYDGLWYGVNNLFYAKSNFIHKCLHRRWFNTKKIRVAKNLTRTAFSNYAAQFTDDIVNYALKKNNKDIFCFNENLSAMFPEKIAEIAPSCRIILVIRDPRDVYADSFCCSRRYG